MIGQPGALPRREVERKMGGRKHAIEKGYKRSRKWSKRKSMLRLEETTNHAVGEPRREEEQFPLAKNKKAMEKETGSITRKLPKVKKNSEFKCLQ